MIVTGWMLTAHRLPLIAVAVAGLVCLGLCGCRRAPSEYSAELVLRTVSRHPVFEEIAYEKLDAKVAAVKGKVRLETPDFVLIVFSEHRSGDGKLSSGEDRPEGRGWLLLNRGRLEVVEPEKPGVELPQVRQPVMRKYIPLTARNLAAWPRLGALVVLASQLAPPPDGKAHVCLEGSKDCRKVAAETLAGRATEKWEYVESGRTVRVWTDVKLGGVPVRSDLFELKSIFEGPQEAALFELPAGYEEYSNKQ